MNHPGLKRHAYKTKQQTYGPALEDILDDVAIVFEASIVMVRSTCKKEKYVLCRRIYFYATKYLTDASLKNVGALLNKDHTNPLWHRLKCKQWLIDGDEIFTRAWNKYKVESKIWNQYMNS